jgi:flavin reductase (DIM6/NTAB) family NADH-FMN oxidoreductase RutF
LSRANVLPLIEGSAATLECRLVNTYPGGDHVVFIGEVERMVRRYTLAQGRLVTRLRSCARDLSTQLGWPQR